MNGDKRVIMHRDMFVRMDAGIKEGFYLESIFCEYAAIEGRLEVICGLLGCPCNQYIEDDIRKSINISHRVKCLQKLYKKHLVCQDSKCKITNDVWKRLEKWNRNRNIYVHGLCKNADQYKERMKEAKEIAEEGKELAELLYCEAKRIRRRKQMKPELFKYDEKRCKANGCILKDAESREQ